MDVLLRPTMVGILRCGKMLPPQLNLVIEIEFADATTALWSENAGAHPAGATLSTDFEIQNVRVLASQTLRWWSPSTGCSSQEGPGVQLPHGARAAVQRPERRGGAQRHRGARLHETHGRVCDLLGQRRGLQDPLAGHNVAPIGAARQEDSAEFACRRGRALVEARHVWLMARQRGVLFEVRHLMLEPLVFPLRNTPCG